MENDLISVADAAAKIGIQRGSLFKVLKRFGLRTTKQKSANHKGQAISYISLEDFEFIVNNYTTTNRDSKESETQNVTLQSDIGEFYLIQLEPEHDSGRFKLGFTVNISERLRSHRCSAPFADVVATWPCHLLWEKTAIDSVTQGCEKLYTEVFRTDDIKKVKEKCDQFFSLMPNPENILR